MEPKGAPAQGPVKQGDGAKVERQTIATKPFRTHLNRAGAGNPEAIVFLHGSGPGASGWSNWRLALPVLGTVYDCLAPDSSGYAASEHPPVPPTGTTAWMDLWVEQVVSLLDTLGLGSVHLVGNSMGGAIALQLAHRHPGRIKRIVLMGPSGAPFRLNPKLDAIWGFYARPSVELMTEMINWFAYDPKAFSQDLSEIARMRFEAAMDPQVRRTYQAMFPAPRQRYIDDYVLPDQALAQVTHPCLIIHGRDDPIVPLETSLYLLQKLPRVQLHVFGQCSHWTQIEYPEDFHNLLLGFFRENVR